MEDSLRSCPNCKSTRFFMEPGKEMIFLAVRADGTFQTTREPHTVIEKAGDPELFCTSCGWHGHTNEMLAPKGKAGSHRVLLHICCGPCSIVPIQTLQDEGFAITGLFFNPNIHPLSEYLKRRDGALEVAEKLGIRLIVKDNEYDPRLYLRATAFREENRCFHCYQLRLERTAQIARRGNFTYFTSSLLYSKMQKHEDIIQLGNDLSKGKTSFLYRDFRTGWKQGILQSKDWNIYRQQYCGCIYSEYERYKGELQQ